MYSTLATSSLSSKTLVKSQFNAKSTRVAVPAKSDTVCMAGTKRIPKKKAQKGGDFFQWLDKALMKRSQQGEDGVGYETDIKGNRAGGFDTVPKPRGGKKK
mmetsp:Transcript_40356/g.48922  ORF Transcript_40356/g.48922 Transcript_40356/m.48922 type:complete len:101 (-) Transcript_40356:367-669(-)|eukprot:CAMPEP_0197848832 /NCGR_PEP_ID=MMETSP1438-20131217/10182_1 /TAXON_ID=1461541 /ORGANISM="Pterosperma sp., Strain CCMP1384" /LENGTH=100 /DNA_ID=CAMNT_0043461261 /DNA_START=63 /DNA_END=365 /DNA_ORIENTATION=+